MIELINLKNYLLFNKENLHFNNNINLILGESSSGKSLIFKSIYELLGESHSKDDFSISIQLNNNILKKERKNNKIFYFINDELSSLKKVKEFFKDVIVISQNSKNNISNNFFKTLITNRYQNINKIKEYALELKKLNKNISDINSNFDEEISRLESIYEDFEEFIEIDFNQEFSSDNLEEELNHYKEIFQKTTFLEQTANDIKSDLNKSNLSIQNILNEVGDINIQIEDKISKMEENLSNKEDLILLEKSLNKFKSKYKIYDNDSFQLKRKEIKLNLKKIKDEQEDYLLTKEKIKELKKLYFQENSQLFLFCKKEKEKLIKEIESNLKDLKMNNASFIINLSESTTINTNGSFDLEILFQPNKGFKAMPLNKIASGGELSRILIALNLIGKHQNKTLILDEIDTGLGGDTAKALSLKIQELGKNNQIIYITHLPQMAMIADNYIQIYKITENEQTISKIKNLNKEEISIEIARLMGDSSNIDLVNNIRRNTK